MLVPTHIHGNILDLVITSSGINISDLVVTQPVQSISSDHYIISFAPFCITSHYSKPCFKYVFDFSKAYYDSICSFLLDVDFSVCLQSNDIEFIWTMIKSSVYYAMCLFIPKTSM